VPPFLPQHRKKTHMTQTSWGLRAIGAAGLVWTCAGLAADTEVPKPHDPAKAQLPAVVVTATKTPTTSDRTAASLTVIDHAEIERQQFRLLADALRLVPGLTIADRGAPGTVTGVFTRGTKTEHTRVLLDGRPVPANPAGAYNLETTPLDNIERIEVLRGPAASLYGGKTIGGVINILTRSGRGLEKPESSAFFEAGSYGSYREGFSALGAEGDLDWAFEASRADLQGQRVNSRFEQSSANGRTGWQLNDTLRLELDGRWYEASVGLPGNRFSNDTDDHVVTEFWSLSPRLVWDITDGWRQSVTVAQSNFRQAATGLNGIFNPNNRITSHHHFLEYQSEFRALDLWSITAGIWLEEQNFTRFNDNIRSKDIDQNETNWAYYLQSQLELLPGLDFNAGFRYDHYSDFGTALTWRSGIAWRVPALQTLLHGNYGTAFSPPSGQDREPALFGDPQLASPERSRGWEFGVEQPMANANITLSATYFRNELTDTYQFDLATFSLQPIGRALTQGMEFGAKWEPHESFSINTAYSYLDADDLSGAVRLVRRPRQTLSGGLVLKPHERLTLSLSALYVMDREDFDPVTFDQKDLEDYLLGRLSVNWRVRQNLEVFARIENLFDDNYEEAAGFPAFDTGAYAGVKIRF
jgi:vitamin B12 transporter